jgi:hypothetical protein
LLRILGIRFAHAAMAWRRDDCRKFIVRVLARVAACSS